jgi:hypothetical protein
LHPHRQTIDRPRRIHAVEEEEEKKKQQKEEAGTRRHDAFA